MSVPDLTSSGVEAEELRKPEVPRLRRALGRRIRREIGISLIRGAATAIGTAVVSGAVLWLQNRI